MNDCSLLFIYPPILMNERPEWETQIVIFTIMVKLFLFMSYRGLIQTFNNKVSDMNTLVDSL